MATVDTAARVVSRIRTQNTSFNLHLHFPFSGRYQWKNLFLLFNLEPTKIYFRKSHREAIVSLISSEPIFLFSQFNSIFLFASFSLVKYRLHLEKATFSRVFFLFFSGANWFALSRPTTINHYQSWWINLNEHSISSDTNLGSKSGAW